MAVDSHGHPLPYSPEEVRAIVERAIHDGDIMAVILRNPGGDFCVQVFGPPSQTLLNVLETTTNAYRRALQGH